MSLEATHRGGLRAVSCPAGQVNRAERRRPNTTSHRICQVADVIGWRSVPYANHNYIFPRRFNSQKHFAVAFMSTAAL